MELKQVTQSFTVASALVVTDMAELAAAGFKSVINNRPDGEADNQPNSQALQAAAAEHGIKYHALPVIPGEISDDHIETFKRLLETMPGPAVAFCRTGTRAISLWALSAARHIEVEKILATCASIGYDLAGLRPRLLEQAARAHPELDPSAESGATEHTYDVVIVGGGAGGIATAASLLRRRPDLDIVLVEPRSHHYYQPGWTLVGAGVFTAAETERSLSNILPASVKWLHAAVAGFEPGSSQVILEDGERLRYRTLVVSPGLRLNWQAVDGLVETLGQNGVVSNYSYASAPYTWECVQQLREGRAIFSQPPMPIKCAGAPQKAMYLSCDHWLRSGRLKDIEVGFYTAGNVLFGIESYVPALQQYVERYEVQLNYQHNLVAVDGPAGKAWFERTGSGGTTERTEVSFDLLHVTPPQGPHRFIQGTALADGDGWVQVDPATLQHVAYENVFGLGDGCSAPNAKTAAAVRKQAPVVAVNLLATLDGKLPSVVYDGYGSCPLTVERGKVVLAEFGYGGRLLPTFPGWLLDSSQPSRLAWFFKTQLLPPIYWNLMLKGREWLVHSESARES